MFLGSRAHAYKNRFTGSGRVHGNFMSVTGRLDQIRTARLSANFTTSDGHPGHVIGVCVGAQSSDDPLEGD